MHKAQNLPAEFQALSELGEDIDRVVARAKKRKRQHATEGPKPSKSEQLKGIPAHRQDDKNAIRRAEADEIRAAAGLDVSSSNSTADQEDNVPVPLPQPDNVRDIRRRMMSDE